MSVYIIYGSVEIKYLVYTGRVVSLALKFAQPNKTKLPATLAALCGGRVYTMVI